MRPEPLRPGLPETVVIVGATGFVGQNLVRYLQAKIPRIVPVSGSGNAVSGIAGIRFADLDRLAIGSEAVVVNLAAHRYDAARFAEQQPQIFARNVEIAARVYEFCAERGVKEVRAASSIAVYPADDPVRDDAAPIDLEREPYDGEAFYGWSKRLSELTARLFAARLGIRTISFRLTNPYGPFDCLDAAKAHVVPALIIRALTGSGPFVLRGDPAARRDFIYVGDVCKVFAESLAWRGRDAVYNLGCGEAATIGELARSILELTGGRRELVLGRNTLGGVTERQVRTDRLRADFAIERFTPLREGLAQTIEWYRDALRS